MSGWIFVILDVLWIRAPSHDNHGTYLSILCIDVARKYSFYSFNWKYIKTGDSCFLIKYSMRLHGTNKLLIKLSSCNAL